MKFLQTTQYLTPEDAELIIGFLEDIRDMLLVNYEEEIRHIHRSRRMEECTFPQSNQSIFYFPAKFSSFTNALL